MSSKNNVKKSLLIESQYLGPLHYYARILYHDEIIIEKFEYYQKSSYRNRCYILSPNGPLRLSVQLRKRNSRCLIKDLALNYDYNWQKVHWMSLCSAYRSSPYFEYYEDDLKPFYEIQYPTLFDFNQALFEQIIQSLNIEKTIRHSAQFEKKPSEEIMDFRSKILPNKKSDDPVFKVPKYVQVFEEKTGFHPNLSILDLLFAEGPNTVAILQEAMKAD